MDLYKCLHARHKNIEADDREWSGLYPLFKDPEWHSDQEAVDRVIRSVQFRVYELNSDYQYYNIWYLPAEKRPKDWQIDYKKLYKQVFYYYGEEFYKLGKT